MIKTVLCTHAKKRCLLLIGILMFTNLSFAQKNQLVKLSTSDTTIEFHITECKNVKTDIDKKYYWFKGYKVFSTQGNYAGVLLDGVYKVFYKDGQLKELGLFKKGLKHKDWYSWNKLGDIQEHQKYRRGKSLNEPKKGKNKKPIKKTKSKTPKNDKNKGDKSIDKSEVKDDDIKKKSTIAPIKKEKKTKKEKKKKTSLLNKKPITGKM